jgi:ankyrin repeat protein
MKEKSTILLKDLLRFREFNAWCAPVLDENINWFRQEYGTTSLIRDYYKDDDLLTKRLEILISDGASLEGLATAFVNTKRKRFFQKSIEYGLNLNEINRSGNYCLVRAFSRKLFGMAEIIIDSGKFNNGNLDKNGQNILHWAAEAGNFKLINKIIEKDVETLFCVDKADQDVLMTMFKNLNKKNEKELAGFKSFLEVCSKSNEAMYFLPKKVNENLSKYKEYKANYVTLLNYILMEKKFNSNFVVTEKKSSILQKV